ncbi:MAG: hypothetical protein J0H14_05610 [Alphaproteobacteria bacterium]|nr:hypothetical protein [Alphaproteobacteria bacterium]
MALLYSITGASNGSYNKFVGQYDHEVEEFIESRGVTFADLKRRCAKFLADPQHNPLADAERNLLYLVSGVRSDRGRSDVYFLSTEDDFLKVDSIYRRALDLADINSTCLPGEGPAQSAPPAEWQVTAGLVGVAASDRMNALAGSRRERRRVTEVRDEATKFLASGVQRLTELREHTKPKDLESPFDKFTVQIFGTQPWDLSISLGKYTLDRLNRLPQ